MKNKTDYRTISKICGDNINHSTIRNVFFRTLEKISKGLLVKFEQEINDNKIKKMVSDREFQDMIIEIVATNKKKFNNSTPTTLNYKKVYDDK